MRTERINFLDVYFDRLSFKDIKDRLQAATSRTPYAYIVTPNVDHIVRVHRVPELRELYDEADLCVCDSRILRFLARLRGIKLPLVAGSDLSAALFSEVIKPGDRIALVGGDRSRVEWLEAKFPGIHFLQFEPPMGLCSNPEARRSAADFVAASDARFVFIAVGSPQQEMIAKEARERPGASGIALCIGASLDFVVGRQKRAPRLLQALGLEWAHRLATNPRRLWRRYLVDGVRIFPIWFRWRASSRRQIVTVVILVAFTFLVTARIYSGVSFNRRTHMVPSADTALPPPAAQSIAAIRALPPPNLLKPVPPEEATKQNAERPFVDRSDTPASRFVLRTSAEDRDRAVNCLAQAIYYEAAGEGVDGGRAVAQVVLNRMRHPGYPASVCGVVYQGAEQMTGCQFTFACDGSLQRVPVSALWVRSRAIAEAALAGRVFALVGHATHYHADYVLPYWADSLDKTVQVARHIFYRLRGSLGDGGSFFQRYAGTEPQIVLPAATKIVAPPADAAQLASTLMSDKVNGTTAEVETAAPAASPLLVDSSHGALIADEQGAAVVSRKHKSSSDCGVAGDRRQLTPLGATDMRSAVAPSGC